MNLSASEITWVFKQLKQVNNLSAYTADELKQLIEQMKKKTYMPKNIIIKQGELGHFFFIIHKGQIAVSVTHKNKRKLIASLNDGDYFGEMSLLSGKDCVATVTAITETEVFLFEPDDFRFILMHNPPLVKSMSKVIHERRQELFEEIGESYPHDDDILYKMNKYFNIGF